MHGGVVPPEKRSGELWQCWLTIPPLKSICWEALLHYWPGLLKNNPPKALYYLGLSTLDISECELLPPASSIPPPEAIDMFMMLPEEEQHWRILLIVGLSAGKYIW